MKKLLVSLLLSTMLSAVFFSCKKYEDGPLISFVPKDKRLSGAWSFEKVTSTTGGTTVDITSYFTGSTWDINEDNTGTLKITGQPDQAFTWAWDDKKEFVTFTFTSDNSVEKAEILKLKQDELWFKITDDGSGDVTEFHLAQ